MTTKEKAALAKAAEVVRLLVLNETKRPGRPHRLQPGTVRAIDLLVKFAQQNSQ